MQLQRSVQRIPKTTTAQRQEWIRKFFASGLSREAFAREHGLKLSTVSRWIAETRAGTAPVAKPVVFDEVQLPLIGNGSSAGWAMEVLTPSGLIVRLR